MYKIILIVGASGVGKDSLLKYAKGKINANFVTRHITRAPDMNEQNYYIDKDGFRYLQKRGFFVSYWEAHENFYGIAKNEIKKGLNIISISRGAIKDFEKVYDDVKTIEITISKDELRQRLVKRGRESIEQIEKRLERNYSNIEAKNLVQFINDEAYELSSIKFLKLLV